MEIDIDKYSIEELKRNPDFDAVDSFRFLTLSFRKNPITDKIIPRIKNLQELIVDELDDIENFYAVMI